MGVKMNRGYRMPLSLGYVPKFLIISSLVLIAVSCDVFSVAGSTQSLIRSTQTVNVPDSFFGLASEVWYVMDYDPTRQAWDVGTINSSKVLDRQSGGVTSDIGGLIQLNQYTELVYTKGFGYKAYITYSGAFISTLRKPARILGTGQSIPRNLGDLEIKSRFSAFNSGVYLSVSVGLAESTVDNLNTSGTVYRWLSSSINNASQPAIIDGTTLYYQAKRTGDVFTGTLARVAYPGSAGSVTLATHTFTPDATKRLRLVFSYGDSSNITYPSGEASYQPRLIVFEAKVTQP